MRGRKMIDLTGQRFGKLTVIEFGERRFYSNGRSYFVWRCLCDCGRESMVAGHNLTYCVTRSCGCLRGHNRREG